jgi:hypothetical protein
MPKDTPSNTHDSEYLHSIPYIEHQYELYKVVKQKNRIVCTLAVTSALLVGVLAYILLKI